MKLVLLPLALLLPLTVSANDPFAELDDEMALFDAQRDNSSETQTQFQQYLQTQESDYQVWQTAYLKEFDQFQQAVVEKWGQAEASQAEYEVEFSRDKNLKSVVDYAKGQVKIELLVDKAVSQSAAEKAIKMQFANLLADKNSNIARVFADQTVNENGDLTISAVAFSEKNKQLTKKIIVQQTEAQAQEIDKQADRALLPESLITEQEAALLATQEKTALLKSSQLRLSASDENYQQAQKSADKHTKIVTYTLPLPKNSLQQRASKYVAYAEKESAINHIPVPLIMAIMHSESAFNPNATSAVPAYGLMQIVPRTAGHDVNRLVRHIDKPMNKEELYVPEINIETGSAYLNILDKRYLKAIKNDTSRLYCTIAAYNTGAGNVAKVFNRSGSRNINQAAEVINQLTAEQVYQQLLAKLPYDETKHYLQRVNTRIDLYQSTATTN